MGKYPTPEKARSRFESGVEAARDKWAARARDGAEDYQLWFTGFANTVYPIISGLPDKAGLSIEERVMRRALPVAQAIHRLSVTYQSTKIRKIAEAVAKTVAPAVR